MTINMILGLFSLDPSIIAWRRQDGRTELLTPGYRMEFACPTCGDSNATFFPDVPCMSWKRHRDSGGARIWCCEICQQYESLQMASVNDDRKLDKAIKDMFKHIDVFHRRKNPKSHIGNGAPTGPFAFTLTMSPKDGLTEDDMMTAVRKVLGQKSCPVKAFAWYLEYGDSGTKTHPHIHGMYETESGGRIERKHFKRAWAIWDETIRMGAGFRGGYHRPVRHDEHYADYIQKQNGTGDSYGVPLISRD